MGRRRQRRPRRCHPGRCRGGPGPRGGLRTAGPRHAGGGVLRDQPPVAGRRLVRDARRHVVQAASRAADAQRPGRGWLHHPARRAGPARQRVGSDGRRRGGVSRRDRLPRGSVAGGAL